MLLSSVTLNSKFALSCRRGFYYYNYDRTIKKSRTEHAHKSQLLFTFDFIQMIML